MFKFKVEEIKLFEICNNINGQIYFRGRNILSDKSDVVRGLRKFLYFQGEIRHYPTGQCIERGKKSDNLAIMMPCNGSENQKWTFGNYNSTEILQM